MLGILADDHYTAVSLYDLAFFADLLYGWLDFHFNHSFLINYKSRLFGSPGYTAFCQIVDRDLDLDMVTGQDSDVIQAKLS